MRIVFVGDSLTVGVGDPQYLGWPGRLCAASPAAGLGLTLYNLGVRSETSRHIKARLARAAAASASPRRGPDRAVLWRQRRQDRERPAQGRAGRIRGHLFDIVSRATALCPTLVVGPPPLDDAYRCRIEELSDVFAGVCAEMGVGYLEMCRPLCRERAYLDSLVASGDGYHPEAEGYAAFAARVAAWDAWLAWFGLA